MTQPHVNVSLPEVATEVRSAKRSVARLVLVDPAESKSSTLAVSVEVQLGPVLISNATAVSA